MGENAGLRRLTAEKEAVFPRLALSDYEVTSDEDTSHNCTAYAADDKTRKWQWTPFPIPGYYWPDGAEPGDSIDALVSAYGTIGYKWTGKNYLFPNGSPAPAAALSPAAASASSLSFLTGFALRLDTRLLCRRSGVITPRVVRRGRFLALGRLLRRLGGFARIVPGAERIA